VVLFAVRVVVCRVAQTLQCYAVVTANARDHCRTLPAAQHSVFAVLQGSHASVASVARMPASSVLRVTSRRSQRNRKKA
jgi:hypothetical protein